MFPHEVQALVAKILFFIFAFYLLCFSNLSQAATL